MELMRKLARWERDFEREHRRLVARRGAHQRDAHPKGRTPKGDAHPKGRTPPRLEAPQLATPACWGSGTLGSAIVAQGGAAPPGEACGEVAVSRPSQREAEARPPALVQRLRMTRPLDSRHGSKPTHLQKASSQEYQHTQRELKRASQRLLLLGMSCGSLAEESAKSSPGRCSRRSSAASTASPSGGGGAASSHSSRASTPDAVGSGRGQCRV